MEKLLIIDLLTIKVMFYDIWEPSDSNSALYERLVVMTPTLHAKNMGI